MKRIREIVRSPLEPEDKELFWLDISNPNNICLKIYIDGQWKIISASEIYGNYITPTDLQNALNSYVTTTSLSNTLSELHTVLTEAAYTALEEKNPNTFYYTYEEE